MGMDTAQTINAIDLLPLVSQAAPRPVYQVVTEQIAHQAERVRLLVLDAWVEGSVLVEALYAENIVRLAARGYGVAFHSPAEYPPRWRISWDFQSHLNHRALSYSNARP